MLGRLSLKGMLLVPVVGALVALSGCGGSDDKSTDTSSSSSTTKSAAANKIPKKTIGYVNVQGSSPATQAIQAPFVKGAKLLGWDVKVEDAQGDPAKMASTVQGLVTQGVDAIVLLGVSPAAAQQGLSAAKSKGIPVIETSSVQPDPDKLFATQNVPPEAALSTALTNEMIKALGGKGDIVTQQYAQLGTTATRDAVLKKLLKGTDIKIVANHSIDFGNPAQDATKSTTSMVQAHPGISAIWADQDFEFVPATQVLNQLGKKNVKVFGFYPDGAALAALRKGLPAYADVATPFYNVSWQALDQLVNYFVSKKPIGQDPVYKTQYPIKVLTKDNVPAGDTVPFPSVEPFYVARWKKLGLGN